MSLKLLHGYRAIHIFLLVMVAMAFYMEFDLGLGPIIVAAVAAGVVLYNYVPDSTPRPTRLNLIGHGRGHFTFVVFFFICSYNVVLSAMLAYAGITQETITPANPVPLSLLAASGLVSAVFSAIFMLNFTPKGPDSTQ